MDSTCKRSYSFGKVFYYEYLFLHTLDLLCAWSTSERFQDIFGLWSSAVLDSVTRAGSQHTYIEFGAMHPINNSNSYLLELAGWVGGVSEPNPAFEALFKLSRKCFYTRKGIGSEPGSAQLYIPSRRARATTIEANLDEFKSDVKICEIEVTTLSDFVDELAFPSITFLSADTEGGEYEALRAFNDIDSRLASFCIEVDKLSAKRLEESRSYFESKGFVRVFNAISGPDDWYIKRDLVLSLPSPAIFFDNLLKVSSKLKAVPLISHQKSLANRVRFESILAIYGHD